MHQPCPHCDQPDLCLLRLVLIGKSSVPMSKPAQRPPFLRYGGQAHKPCYTASPVLLFLISFGGCATAGQHTVRCV
jgi:hypothetical protein